MALLSGPRGRGSAILDCKTKSPISSSENGRYLALGLGVEPAEDVAGGLLIPISGVLVWEIDEPSPDRNASIITMADSLREDRERNSF